MASGIISELSGEPDSFSDNLFCIIARIKGDETLERDETPTATIDVLET